MILCLSITSAKSKDKSLMYLPKEDICYLIYAIKVE